jgi:hypothetical protein
MTKDHEPINPKIHAHLTGLGYVHEREIDERFTDSLVRDIYYREIETAAGVTWSGLTTSVYRDGSIMIGGKPDAHTPDLLRFLAIAFGEVIPNVEV